MFTFDTRMLNVNQLAKIAVLAFCGLPAHASDNEELEHLVKDMFIKSKSDYSFCYDLLIRTGKEMHIDFDELDAENLLDKCKS